MSREADSPDLEQIADRTEAAAAAPGFGIDARSILDTWGRILEEAAEQPRAVLQAGRELGASLGNIWFGDSDVTEPPDDERFRDPAWQENGLYRRIGQSYRAWSEAMDTWLQASGLEGIERDRARFVLNATRDLLAPVNTLIGNPEALERLQETRGGSLIRGIRNFLDDLRHNHGYPAVADRKAFEIGKDVASTPGAVVFKNELFELIQYQPMTETVSPIPLLYVFSQVNRFYLGDLTPDRSLFRRLLEAGIPVYAISWRNPSREHRHWNMDTYADGIIDAIRVIQQIQRRKKVHLMGLCAGGLVAGAAAGVMQARGDDWVESLSLFVNVLDSRPGESEFGLFVTERSVEAQKAAVRARGVFTERNVFEMFAMLRIEENVMSFFRSNYLLGEAPIKHPLLFWSMDYTRVPAEMQCDFLDLGQYNRLAKKEQRVLGKRVDLSKIGYPVYIMAGSTDHITPWKACYRSTQLFGDDVVFVLTNQNHTQTISSRTDNRHLKYWVARELPADPELALQTATAQDGSWTDHWIEWLSSRSTKRIRARKKLGAKAFPVIAPAPGTYVLEH
ncbi:MAG: PHA/PHB synthase family protein [Pseudomonadales bacterium]